LAQAGSKLAFVEAAWSVLPISKAIEADVAMDTAQLTDS
jgi:hypothetical protein